MSKTIHSDIIRASEVQGEKPNYKEGLLFWDEDQKTWAQYGDDPEVTHQLGYEHLITVKNDSGADIPNGSLVYVSGAETSGQYRALIDLADASDPDKSRVLGWTTSLIEDNSYGKVTQVGEVNDLDTTGGTAGEILYLSDTNPGEYTNVNPANGSAVIIVGYMARVDASAGKVIGIPITLIPQTVASARFQTKSFSIQSGSTGSGVRYLGGYYYASSNDANLTNGGGFDVQFGQNNIAYGAHAFVVAGGAGTTDGSDLILTVRGTSVVNSGGVITRTVGDTEVIVVDCTTASLNEYFETSKKWVGEISFELTSTGGTSFSFDVNYGLAKYDDFYNQDFTIQGIEVVGYAAANDGSVNFELLPHIPTGWTYAATGFEAGSTPIADMAADYGTESDLRNDHQFAWKRTGLNQNIQGSESQGFMIRVNISTNNALGQMDAHVLYQVNEQ